MLNEIVEEPRTGKFNGILDLGTRPHLDATPETSDRIVDLMDSKHLVGTFAPIGAAIRQQPE